MQRKTQAQEGLSLMVSKTLKAKTGSKELSKLARKAIRFQAKEAPSFSLLVLACKAFLRLNLNFKKDIKPIRIKVLSKCR